MQKKFLNNLVQHLIHIQSDKEMAEFLLSILTPQELAEIPKRLEIIKMLKAGVTQREIAKKLEVSIATITRGSCELKRNRFKNV